jgi:hypothetical protein
MSHTVDLAGSQQEGSKLVATRRKDGKSDYLVVDQLTLVSASEDGTVRFKLPIGPEHTVGL